MPQKLGWGERPQGNEDTQLTQALMVVQQSPMRHTAYYARVLGWSHELTARRLGQLYVGHELEQERLWDPTDREAYARHQELLVAAGLRDRPKQAGRGRPILWRLPGYTPTAEDLVRYMPKPTS